MQQKVQVWLVIREKKRRTLLLQTTTARGMFWQPVTGSVEEQEPLEQAAARETREETGLDLGPPKALDFSFEFEADDRAGGKRAVRETVFYYLLSEKPSEIQIDLKEHQAYCWLPAKEVKECLKWSSNQKAFEILLKKTLK